MKRTKKIFLIINLHVSILIYLEVKNEAKTDQMQLNLINTVSILIYLEVKNEAQKIYASVGPATRFNPNLSGSKK